MKKIRCSSLPRLAMCAGSLAACDNLASADSAQSLAGTAGHGALGNTEKTGYYDLWVPTSDQEPRLLSPSKPIDLFLDGLDDMTAGRARWYAKVMDGIIEEHGGAVSIHTEVAMSVVLKNGFGEVELSGHSDLVVICADGVTLVSDWKFNFLEVPEAARNIQLMGYAYLLVKGAGVNLPIGSGDVHTILIAGGNENPFTAAVYKQGTIDRLEKHLFAIVRDALAEDARRCPSDESCKYCPASGTKRCPESIADVLAVPALLQPYEVMPGKDDCMRLFKAIKTVESFKRKFEPMLKECVQADPEGWAELFELKSTGSTRTIKDAQAAYDVFVDTNRLLDAETFLSLVTLPIGKLEAACKPALKERDVPVKDQKLMIAGLLGDNLELKEKAPSLKVVKQ